MEAEKALGKNPKHLASRGWTQREESPVRRGWFRKGTGAALWKLRKEDVAGRRKEVHRVKFLRSRWR